MNRVIAPKVSLAVLMASLTLTAAYAQDDNPATAPVNKLVHSTGLNDSTKWSIPVQTGGFMVDLGQVIGVTHMRLNPFRCTVVFFSKCRDGLLVAFVF